MISLYKDEQFFAESRTLDSEHLFHVYEKGFEDDLLATVKFDQKSKEINWCLESEIINSDLILMDEEEILDYVRLFCFMGNLCKFLREEEN